MAYVKGFQWTQERTKKLVELFEAGEPYHKIAAHFGCKEHQAQTKVYKLGLSSRTNRWTEDQRAELRRLREGGFTWSEIGRRMGMTKTMVASQGKHLGLTGKREDAQPTAYTPEPPPEPAVRGAVTGVCRVWAGGMSKRYKDGKLAFSGQDKALAQHYGGIVV